MAEKSTNDVFEAIGEQLSVTLGASIDGVYLFDGSLIEAVEYHLGQSVSANARAFVFVGLSDDQPETVSGDGLALRSGLVVDIYAVVRGKGRSLYKSGREMLNDISDTIKADSFHHTKRTPYFKDTVVTMELQFRTRQISPDPTLFSHLVRFTAIPRGA